MAVLTDLINTVGLDQSFFYQLALAVLLYFLSKKLFLQPYLESFDKRKELTKGRMKSSKELEEKIEKAKSHYEQKAREVHKKFQELFNRIKQEAQKDFLEERVKAQEEQKRDFKKEKQNLNQALREQNLVLQKEIPFLVAQLVEKMKS